MPDPNRSGHSADAWVRLPGWSVAEHGSRSEERAECEDGPRGPGRPRYSGLRSTFFAHNCLYYSIGRGGIRFRNNRYLFLGPGEERSFPMLTQPMASNPMAVAPAASAPKA